MMWEIRIRFRFMVGAAVLSMGFLCYPMALRAAEGDRRWVFPAEGTVGSITSSPAIGQDGTIYVGSGDNKVYAINPDGTKKWEFATGGKVTSSPAVEYYSKAITIYVGSADGNVYAINSDGTQKWKFEAGASVSSSPAISYLGIVYVGAEDGKVYAISSSDGTGERGEWPFVTGGKITSSPVIDSEGTLYVGSHDHKLYAIYATGKLKWEVETNGIISASPALYEEGATKTVYVGSEDGKIYAVNMDDGASNALNIGSAIASSAAVDNATLYVGANNNRLYALSRTEGTQIWVFVYAGGPIRSSPAIGSDGTLYVGSDDYSLYAITSATGAPKWRFQTGGKVSSSPAIGFGGNVVVGSEEGKLYALESSSARLADLKWPKLCHDVRNTARNKTNELPGADAGADQTVKSSDTVTLNGSNSYDPDYGIPLYSWSQTEGTSVTLSDTTAVRPSFTAPGVDEETTLTFELTVTDNCERTSTDTVTVTVQKKDDDKGCFISTAGF